MKIICKKTDLAKAVQTVSKAVPAKATTSILECLLLRAEKEEITLTGNNLELGIETVMPGNIEEEGSIAIQAKELQECIDRAGLLLKDDAKKPIILNIEENILSLEAVSNMGSMNESMFVVKEGEKLRIGFNPKFLLEMLRVIDDEEVFMYFTSAKTPCTVFGLEKANQDIYNASFLDELLEKTVITKNFEEVVGRKIYKIYQGTCSFSEREKEVYRIAVKEFDKIRRKYFAACGNARKDSMFRILQQLLLLLKICADPSLAYEYDSNEIPTKVKKAIRLLQMWKYEKVAIGVRRIEVADSYYRYLKQAFPERQIFYITGDKVPCKQRQRIVEKLRKTENGILLSTQQSLSESMNIDDVDKIILPELHYNHAAMEQYYFRFIRYTSRNFKQVVFLIYENSIEVNLLKMILAKEKLNLFMKNQLLENGELYERFGINPQIFSLLMTTSVDQEGKLQIQWGEQKIS